jgi:hypothetical protein
MADFHNAHHAAVRTSGDLQPLTVLLSALPPRRPQLAQTIVRQGRDTPCQVGGPQVKAPLALPVARTTPPGLSSPRVSRGRPSGAESRSISSGSQTGVSYTRSVPVNLDVRCGAWMPLQPPSGIRTNGYYGQLPVTSQVEGSEDEAGPDPSVGGNLGNMHA